MPKDPKVSDAQARARAEDPIRTFRGYDLSWDEAHVLIYDDADAADSLAAELGTYAKHSQARFPSSTWRTFSLVRLS